MRKLHDRLTTQASARLTASLLRRLIWGLIAMVWLPLAALPALAAISPGAVALVDPLNIQPALLFTAVVISTMSGATSLLMRIDRELSAAAGKPLPRPWIMSSSHMFGAWLAGILAFILSQQSGFGLWSTLGSVLSASFLGSKFLEVMTEKYLSAGSYRKNVDPA
ncbi:hypothetical protein [Rhodoferax koreensis]|nr:hypothetical protein [Rhodoferax koreense]